MYKYMHIYVGQYTKPSECEGVSWRKKNEKKDTLSIKWQTETIIITSKC